MNNHYWEEAKRKHYSEAKEDDIISRIKECQFVIDKLEGDELWKIVLRDAENWVRQIDNHWQEEYNDKKLAQMRVVKLAANQIKEMKNGYSQEYKYAQEELQRRNEDGIEKDYEQ